MPSRLIVLLSLSAFAACSDEASPVPFFDASAADAVGDTARVNDVTDDAAQDATSEADVSPDARPDSDSDSDLAPVFTDFETVTEEEVHQGDGTMQCVTARCPAPTRALGGGGVWPDEMDLSWLGPIDDESWSLCGQLDQGLAFSVDVYCALADASITFEREQITLAPGETGCVSVDCPGTSSALGAGGGFVDGDASIAAANATLTSIRPTVLGQGWQSCANNTGDAPTTLLMNAYCADDVTREVAFQEGNQPGFDDICIDTSCPRGTRVVGGGGRWTPETRPTALRLTGLNDFSLCGSSSQTAAWSAFAICVEE